MEVVLNYQITQIFIENSILPFDKLKDNTSLELTSHQTPLTQICLIYFFTQYLQWLTTKSFQIFSLSNISKLNLNQNTNSNHNFKINQTRKEKKKKKIWPIWAAVGRRTSGGGEEDRHAWTSTGNLCVCNCVRVTKRERAIGTHMFYSGQ